VCAILARHGFQEVRRRGSHVVMQKTLTAGTITGPKDEMISLGVKG
jgi:predicted RNA binding protein YcfA (HicA-like mRNA interferase family)